MFSCSLRTTMSSGIEYFSRQIGLDCLLWLIGSMLVFGLLTTVIDLCVQLLSGVLLIRQSILYYPEQNDGCSEGTLSGYWKYFLLAEGKRRVLGALEGRHRCQGSLLPCRFLLNFGKPVSVAATRVVFLMSLRRN